VKTKFLIPFPPTTTTTSRSQSQMHWIHLKGTAKKNPIAAAEAGDQFPFFPTRQ